MLQQTVLYAQSLISISLSAGGRQGNDSTGAQSGSDEVSDADRTAVGDEASAGDDTAETENGTPPGNDEGESGAGSAGLATLGGLSLWGLAKGAGSAITGTITASFLAVGAALGSLVYSKPAGPDADVVPPEEVNDVDEEFVDNGDGLPVRDNTGKVHGVLPTPEQLQDYPTEELEDFQENLEGSVEERIRKNEEYGYDAAHGERQAAEQDLIKSVDKIIGNRGS